MKVVNVKTDKGIKRATLIKNNPATVWVKLPDGNVVKRHKVKHEVTDA